MRPGIHHRHVTAWLHLALYASLPCSASLSRPLRPGPAAGSQAGGGGAPGLAGTAAGVPAGHGAALVPPTAVPGSAAASAGAAAGATELAGSGVLLPKAATGQLAGPGEAPPAASPGVPALKVRLTLLVKRVAGAVKAGQPGTDGLRAAAQSAYGALQAGNLAAAGQGADVLERLLGGPAAAGGSDTPASLLPAGSAALTKDLAGLVKRIAPAIAADPACQATLPGLAMKAHACLKSGDTAGAAASIEALRQALDAPAAVSSASEPGRAGPPSGGPTASSGADAPSPGQNLFADAIMQGVDQAQAARQVDGRLEGVQVAQMGGAITQGVAASLPSAAASLGQGRPPNAPPSLSQGVARRFERMQRRNRATLDEVGRGNLGLAASRLVGREPYPPEVEDGYPSVPVRASQPDASASATPASPDLAGARVSPGPLGLPEVTNPRQASVASAGGAGTTQVRTGGMAAMTALDPGWAGTTTHPTPAAPPMAMPPEGFDAHPEASGPTVLSTPQAALTVPNHTGSPPPAVNLGDLREEFPALQAQGPTIMEARRSEQGSQAVDAVPQPDANVQQPVPEPINGATRTFPMGFEGQKQFLQATKELQEAMKESGINSASVGVRGSSVTGKSIIKGTEFGPKSDVDMYIESSSFVGKFKPSPNIPGFIHPNKLMATYPLLRKWSLRWAKILHREVTPGGFMPGSVPNQPTIVVK